MVPGIQALTMAHQAFWALRRHKYVKDLGVTALASWYGSELVKPQTVGVEQVLEQAAQLQSSTGDSARWLGDHTNLQGEVTRKNLRRAEDQTAVGGLRSPHMSLKQIQGAAAFGKWLADRLKSVLRDDDAEAMAATHTLRSAETPAVLIDRARAVRTVLCNELQIAPGPDTVLQGLLIAGPMVGRSHQLARGSNQKEPQAGRRPGSSRRFAFTAQVAETDPGCRCVWRVARGPIEKRAAG